MFQNPPAAPWAPGTDAHLPTDCEAAAAGSSCVNVAGSGHPAHPGGGAVQADLTGGVSLAGVKKLAKEQVACLEDDGSYEAIAVRVSLFEED